jgi:ABC-type polar amino acid transport system ATPase subunit
MIILRDLSFFRGKHIVLNNISLSIERKKIVTFLGKSGIGKTTLLHCIAQLEQQYTGYITVDGKELKSLSPHDRAMLVGFVFQHYYLFPHLSVEQNCIQPMMVVRKWRKEQAQKKTDYFLHQLGVENLAHKYPNQLSGGQQQRVALARALCLEPKVLLLDEPTAALDQENTNSISILLQGMREDGMTIVIATHNLGFATTVSDEIYEIKSGTLITVSN